MIIFQKFKIMSSKKHNKSPILNQIFNNMLKVNSLSLKHNHGNSKNPGSTWQILKSKVTNNSRENPKKLYQELMKKQEDLLLQVYAKLAENDKRKRCSVDKEIDIEYEKLQKKYCPEFKLIKKTNDNHISKQQLREIKTNSFKSKKTSRNLKEQENKEISKEKSGWNFKPTKEKKPDSNVPLAKLPLKETLDRIENLNINTNVSKSNENSDKTLTPGNLSFKNFDEQKIQEKENLKIIENPLKSLNNKQDTSYCQLQQIFYHEMKPNNTNTYKLNNNLQHLRLEIRQAITLGKSPDATVNKLLAEVIEKALKEQYSWFSIQTTINDIKNHKSKQKILHLLQIILRQRIFILCTVRTCNFSNLLMILERLMQPIGAQFAPVLQHFQHCCVIEAIVPENYLKFTPKELRLHLDHDAELLKVKRIDVVDGEQGEVCVQCLPVSMPNTTKSMETKGYNVLNSDYGFRAKKEIILDTKTSGVYRKFVNSLLQIQDIETISDNVLF